MRAAEEKREQSSAKALAEQQRLIVVAALAAEAKGDAVAQREAEEEAREAGIEPYELLRLKNIEKNQCVLSQLGLGRTRK